MPTYIYKCQIKKCSTKIFEVIRSFTDSREVMCPECDVIAARQITSPTVIYKGSKIADYVQRNKTTRRKTAPQKTYKKTQMKQIC